MKERIIITISRQYGSGGRIVGEKIAEILNIPFYDRNLITLAAKKSGFQEHFFENADKLATSSLLYSLSMGMYNTSNPVDGSNNMPLNDKIFLAEYNVIREIAQQGSCVIVGRCADYVLRNDPDAINVFIHADPAVRLKRIREEYHSDELKNESGVLKMDKRRSAYYEYYTGIKWGRVENYDLTIDSGSIGLDHAARLIEFYVRMRLSQK